MIVPMLIVDRIYAVRIFVQRRIVAAMLIAVYCAPLPVYAQTFAPTYRFQHLTIEQGLSQNSVSAITQDKRGFIWFGTQDGLNMYDGYTCTVFRTIPGDTTSLSNNYIQTLYEDRKGTLWIGTHGGGLNMYIRHKATFRAFSGENNAVRSFNQKDIFAICEDQTETLWVGTKAGLATFNRATERFEFLPSLGAVPNTYPVKTLTVSSDGRLWVGTEGGGLASLHVASGQWMVFGTSSSTRLSSDNITALCEAERGILWVGTHGGGIQRVELARQTVLPLEFSSENSVKNTQTGGFSVIRSLTQDRINGTVWIGGDNGVMHYVPANKQAVVFTNNREQSSSIGNNIVCAVYQDKSGGVWFGTEGGGVDYFDPFDQKFTLIRNTQSHSEGSNIVLAVLEGRTTRNQGTVWFGTIDGGVSVYNLAEQTFTTYRHNPAQAQGLSHNSVWALHEDRDGAIWIGTQGGGINCFRPENRQWTRFLHKPVSKNSADKGNGNYNDNGSNSNNLPDNSIFHISEDKHGVLWFATNNGVCTFERTTQTFTRVPYSSSTTDPNVALNRARCVLHDSKGNVWIGTRGGGLCLYNPTSKISTVFQNNPAQSTSLSNDYVLSLLEDSNGRIWIGTYNGLNRFEPQTNNFTVFRRQMNTDNTPFANNTICSIAEDSRQNLWIGTVYGLHRFTPANARVQVFLGTDGLQSNEFNQNTCFRTTQGVMYFGGINGISRFHPDSLRSNEYKAPIVFTGFKKFNKPVSLDSVISEQREITMHEEENFFTVEFALLSFSEPLSNRYQYKLEGFDNDWIDAGTKREANYTNLSGGRYTLRVRAANHDGVWNEDGAALPIVIHPLWWKTFWFRATAGCCVMFLLFAAYKWRVYSIEHRAATLARLVEERTLELSVSNEEIRAHNESLLLLNQEKNEFLGIAAHDLKNPLMGIMMSASIIRQYGRRMTNDEVSEQIDQIISTTKRMKETITNLLDINAIESGKLNLTFDVVNIGECVHNVVKDFEYRANEKNIRLHYTASAAELMIVADIHAVIEILENLISNAIKYSPQGKNVWVSAEQFVGKPFVCVKVRDEGPGLTEEDKTKLFGKFTRLSAQPTGGEHATGLGLSIVKKMTEAMHGTVHCESVFGEGATFIVQFPVS